MFKLAINQLQTVLNTKQLVVTSIALSIGFIVFLNNLAIAKPVQVSSNPTVKHILELYSKYPTVKSKFLQVADNGTKTYGWFILDRRNGRARVEYYKLPTRIIINNNTLLLQQLELGEKSYIPLINNPLKFIVNNSPKKLLGSVSVSDIKTLHGGKQYLITVSTKDKAMAGKTILVFDRSYFLSGWITINNLGEKIVVKLLNPIFSNISVPSNIFNTHHIIKIAYDSIKVTSTVPH